MNRISHLFGIRYPIIQGGMAWCSGWRLAAAVSEAGGLGLLGAGSMHPETLREHIRKCRQATSQPFGVNVPLMYPEIDKIMQIIIDEEVGIVFTSAGNPKTWTEFLHNHGIKVAHVVSSSRFAAKCEEAGVDAIVAEGFEAGGHNGRVQHEIAQPFANIYMQAHTRRTSFWRRSSRLTVSSTAAEIARLTSTQRKAW